MHGYVEQVVVEDRWNIAPCWMCIVDAHILQTDVPLNPGLPVFSLLPAKTVLFVFPRSVYDGQEHGLFMEKLDARIRNHDREIEKMCNHHFQGFVDSITELLKVRGEAQKLKVRRDRELPVDFNASYVSLIRLLLFPQSQVTDTNRRLQEEGKEVSWKVEIEV